MTAIADDVERSQPRTPMLVGRFRTWLVMIAVVGILCGMLFGYDQGVIAGALARQPSAKAPTLQVDLA